MAPSPEYPDLKWMPSRAWGEGRDGKAVRYIVIHYTAGSERSTSAEDGAIYDQHRDDGTSTHYFVDRDSIVQCVRTRDRANAARHKGNRLGIQYELCGTAQTRAQWLDAASLPTLKLAAKQVARDCKRYDIPARRLTVAETRRAWTAFPDGPKGIVGHVDCTNAYPEDGGDHTDPGAQFPWDLFLDMVRAELNPQEADVALADDLITITDDTADEIGKKAGDKVAAATLLQLDLIHSHRAAVDAAEAVKRTLALETAVAGLRTVVLQLVAKDVVDEQALVAMLAPAVASQVIAALPAGADQVSQEEVNAAVETAFRNAFSS